MVDIVTVMALEHRLVWVLRANPLMGKPVPPFCELLPTEVADLCWALRCMYSSCVVFEGLFGIEDLITVVTGDLPLEVLVVLLLVLPVPSFGGKYLSTFLTSAMKLNTLSV